MSNRDHPMLKAALERAEAGWPVFPCHRGTKAPLVEGDRDGNGKVIPNTGGVKKASTDEATIRGWWRKTPEAMIGCSVGAPIGAFVIDLDHGEDKKTGEFYDVEDLLTRLAEACGGALPDTLTALTPKGGRHLYYRLPADLDVKNWVRFMDGCDIRTTGGYTILPPSVRDDGRPYLWLDPATPIAEPTPAMLEAIPRLAAEKKARDAEARREARDRARANGPAPALRPSGIAPRGDVADRVRKYVDAAIADELRAIETAPSGSRNQALNDGALKIGRFVGGGYIGEDEALAAIRAAARGNPGRDSDHQLEATIASGFAAGVADPRDLSDVETPRGREARPRGRQAAQPARDASPAGAGETTSSSSPSTLSRPPGSADFSADPPSPSFHAEGKPGSHAVDDRPWWVRAGVDRPSFTPDAVKARAAEHARLGLALRCALMARTDLGNEERFRARFGDRFLFCPEQGWAEWTGKRWRWHHQEGAPAAVEIACAAVARAIAAEADMLASTGVRDYFDWSKQFGPPPLDYVAKVSAKGEPTFASELLHKWALATESQARLKAIWQLAQPRLTVEAERFDTDAMLFNVQNGTLSFERVNVDGCMDWIAMLKPHRREDYITKISPAIYDPFATAPRYDAFLAEVQPSEGMRRFIHAWGGLGLTAIKVQKIVQHYGTGRNGKGTTVEAHAYVGGDYAGTINIESLLNTGQVRSGSGPSPDMAKLPGLRMLRVTEPEERSVLAEALVKRLTGNDPIDARQNYGPFFTFKPVFKLSFQGNYELDIKGTDAGIWGRMRLIPWDVEIPDERQDPELDLKLQAEASGILNHLIEGLIDYLTNGLPETAEIKQRTQDYRDRSDPVGEFLKECTRPKPGFRVPSRWLASLYAAWAKANGHVDRNGRPLSEKALAPKLRTKKLKHLKSGIMWWEDIETIRQTSDYVDPFTGEPITVEPMSAAEWEDRERGREQGREDR